MEYNPCHNPAGRPDGGQFCSTTGPASGTAGSTAARTPDEEFGQYTTKLRRYSFNHPGGVAETMVGFSADGQLVPTNTATLNSAIRGVRPFKDSKDPMVRSMYERIMQASQEGVLVGTDTQINLTSAFLKQVRGGTTIHTHPNGSSFSIDDLRSMLSAGVSRVIVIGPEKEWYELRADQAFHDRFSKLSSSQKRILFDDLDVRIIKAKADAVEKTTYKLAELVGATVKHYNVQFTDHGLDAVFRIESSRMVIRDMFTPSSFVDWLKRTHNVSQDQIDKIHVETWKVESDRALRGFVDKVRSLRIPGLTYRSWLDPQKG